MSQDKKVNLYLVVGAQGTGKSTLNAGLEQMLARKNKHVVVLESDEQRRVWLADKLKSDAEGLKALLSDSPGAFEALSENADRIMDASFTLPDSVYRSRQTGMAFFADYDEKARESLREGKDVIVSMVMGPGLVPKYEALAEREPAIAGVEVRGVLLEADAEHMHRRSQEREQDRKDGTRSRGGYSDITPEKVLATGQWIDGEKAKIRAEGKEPDMMNLAGKSNWTVIDTSKMTREEVLDKAAKGLQIAATPTIGTPGGEPESIGTVAVEQKRGKA